jgi:ATPase subunit of ABC transporter with duplicated ATPase domains
MARLAPTELKKSNIQRPFIRFEQAKPAGREAVTAKGLRKSFGDNHVLKGIDLEITRGDKIAIIGGNGIGKTTLLRCLIGDLTPDSGTVKWGHGMTWGYYPQDSGDQVTPGMTVLDWLSQFNPTDDPQVVRGVLGRMLFSGEDALKPTAALSGGEVARLLLSRLMLRKDPVLVFDEPTNHLDLESVNALGEGLSLFAGTVLLVSHDRDLISDVATRVLSFTPEGVIDYLGTYEEYLETHPLPERPHKKKW